MAATRVRPGGRTGSESGVSTRSSRNPMHTRHTMRITNLPYDFRVLLAQYAEEFGIELPKMVRTYLVRVAPFAAEVRAELERTGGWEDGRGDEDIEDPVEREWQYTRRLGRAMKSTPNAVAPLLLGGPRTILSPGDASLWDGRHRVIAAEELGIEKWPALDFRTLQPSTGRSRRTRR